MSDAVFLTELADPLPAVGASVELDGDEGRHAAVVRRIGPGEVVVLGDGVGRAVRGTVTASSKRGLTIQVEEHHHEAEPSLRVTAVQALAKGDRGELAVEVMTEAGVHRVVPWSAHRSMVRWSGERAEKGLRRWRSTAREATKQSRRLRVPEVTEAATTAEVAELIRTSERAYVLHESATRPLAEAVASSRVPGTPTGPSSVLVVVGPEGGITDEELAEFTAAGAEPVLLGSTVLRTSTAGVVAIAQLQALVAAPAAERSTLEVHEPAQDEQVGDDPASDDLASDDLGGEGGFGFTVGHRGPGLARTGVIRTPHGEIRTPAFIAVGTKATVKAVLPETMTELGAQAVLANAYHLYLQPGHERIDRAGGLGQFMNWPGPTFTDSGGFQVMSLGAGFKKVLAMDTTGLADDDVIAEGKQRRAHVDDDGVTFTSHLDGSKHRFTPEVSMQVQHGIGADVIFAFDELTTLMNTRTYKEEALERTRLWAKRCLDEHQRLTLERETKPYQALFGVIQGAQYEDLRTKACADLSAMRGTVTGEGFDGYGIGGAIEKERLGEIVGWCSAALPEDRPRHLLGISEPDDLFAAVAAGADTFDCVSPSRVARNAALYTRDGRFNVTTAANRDDLGPIDPECDCYTCAHYSRSYLHHLFKAKEIIANTLATIHNERFIVRLVDQIRDSLANGDFAALRDDVLGRYYAAR